MPVVHAVRGHPNPCADRHTKRLAQDVAIGARQRERQPIGDFRGADAEPDRIQPRPGQLPDRTRASALNPDAVRVPRRFADGDARPDPDCRPGAYADAGADSASLTAGLAVGL
jgi:hypothetical protein